MTGSGCAAFSLGVAGARPPARRLCHSRQRAARRGAADASSPPPPGLSEGIRQLAMHDCSVHALRDSPAPEVPTSDWPARKQGGMSVHILHVIIIQIPAVLGQSTARGQKRTCTHALDYQSKAGRLRRASLRKIRTYGTGGARRHVQGKAERRKKLSRWAGHRRSQKKKIRAVHGTNIQREPAQVIFHTFGRLLARSWLPSSF